MTLDVNPQLAGYANPAYAEAVSQGAEVRRLPRCGGSIILRSIRDGSDCDAIGPYPLFACSDWSALAADIAELSEQLISLTIVTDPFGNWNRVILEDAFPDRAVPYKEHFVVDLSQPTVARHHRRNIARALKAVSVEKVENPADFLDDWIRLYDELVSRHEIRGVAKFSRESFAAQLAVPGMVVLRAVHDEDIVGATLWYVGGSIGYYHLGAYTDVGYSCGASFALFAYALDHFASANLEWLSLGAGAGVSGDSTDGLTRFKRGWSNGTRTAYLCGRVLSPLRYSTLTTGLPPTSFFPAYRTAADE
jgi:hypothetical protein